MEKKTDSDFISELWIRYIGVEEEVFEHIDRVSKAYGIRMYPSEPVPEKDRPGKIRIYLKILLKKEDAVDE